MHSPVKSIRITRERLRRAAWLLATILSASTLPVLAAPASAGLASTWPQAYRVERDNAANRLSLSTPYYTVQHALDRGGAITSIRLKHGRATNLLVRPLAASVRDAQGALFSTLNDRKPTLSLRRDGLTEIVSFEAALADESGRPSGVRVKTSYEYHWGYIKVRQEFNSQAPEYRVTELSPLATVVDPILVSYG